MPEGTLNKEIKESITTLLESVIDFEEGPPETGVESPEAKRQRVREQLGQQLDAVNAQCAAGIDAFAKKDPAKRVVKILKRIEKALSKEDYGAVVTAFNDDDIGHLQQIAFQTMDEGELDAAQAMYTFLMTMRPTDHQSYVGLMMVLWNKEGPAAAADVYASLIEHMPSPALLYFAADCFNHAGRRMDAEQALRQGIEMLEEEVEGEERNEDEEELLQEMRKFLNDLLKAS